MSKTDIRQRRAAGFTVIELMMVVLIIAILAGLVLSIAGIAGKKADVAKARGDMERIKNVLEEYRIDKGIFPDNLNQVSPKTDPWGRDYRYEVETPKKITFKIWSQGPDGKDNTEDDVNLSKGQ